VADAQVGAPVKGLVVALAAVLALTALFAGPLAAPARAATLSPLASSTTSTPVTGNLTGPSYLATASNGTYLINATGGPAYVQGSLVGTMTWKAKLSATNTTGTSVTPANGTLTSQKGSGKITVKTGAIPERIDLIVTVTSSFAGSNKTLNLTKSIRAVVPYALKATLVAGPNAGTLPFVVLVGLDGKPVGNVSVPALAPSATYDLEYRYATLGLSAGYHTFTLSLADAHGLVTFGNGRTVEAFTFYVAPAPSSETVWYVVGVVAFFGVLFIYATRVAARRRAPTRR
jgi:hypothetical protein